MLPIFIIINTVRTDIYKFYYQCMFLLLNAFIIISIISLNIFGIYLTIPSEQTFLIFIIISTFFHCFYYYMLHDCFKHVFIIISTVPINIFNIYFNSTIRTDSSDFYYNSN